MIENFIHFFTQAFDDSHQSCSLQTKLIYHIRWPCLTFESQMRNMCLSSPYGNRFCQGVLHPDYSDLNNAIDYVLS